MQAGSGFTIRHGRYSWEDETGSRAQNRRERIGPPSASCGARVSPGTTSRRQLFKRLLSRICSGSSPCLRIDISANIDFGVWTETVFLAFRLKNDVNSRARFATGTLVKPDSRQTDSVRMVPHPAPAGPRTLILTT